MKRTVILTSLVLLAVACKGRSSDDPALHLKTTDPQNSTQNDAKKLTPTPVTVKTLTGYFFKNTHTVENDPSFFVFSNKTSFEDYVGVGRTMTNRIEQPDFGKEIAAAIVLKPTNKKTEIKIVKTERTEGNVIRIYYKTQVGDPMTYTAQPLALFSLAKSGVDKIQFMKDNQLAKEIVVNRRSAGAPQSLDDLKRNFTGLFAGVLPCADCSGIDTKLKLNPDFTFVMETVYQGKGNGKKFTEKGKWTPSEDLAIIEFNYDKKDSFYYAIVDKNTLEKLDINGQRIESKLNYRLVRK